jgi:hypothetical protein
MPSTIVRGSRAWRIGALFLVSAVTACTASEAEIALPPAPKPTSTVSECPTVLDAGVSGALHCTYRYVDESVVYPLTLSTESTEPPSVVEARLNALSPKHVQGEQINGCTAMGQTQYVIVLAYPDGAGVEVRVDPRCSLIEQDGAIVSPPRKMADLLSAWPEEAW